jgi:hypothetical protein
MGHRVPSVVSFLLAIKGLVDFVEGSHLSAALWIAGALLCIVFLQWWAFHDMRMEYKQKESEMKKALRAQEQPQSRFRVAEYAEKLHDEEMDLLAKREARRNLGLEDTK